MVGGSVHELYVLIAISTPGFLTRQVHVDNRQHAKAVSLAQEHFADIRQKLLSTVTLRSCSAVQQRKAQRQPGEDQRELVTELFGTL
jgi:hypothetical protein